MRNVYARACVAPGHQKCYAAPISHISRAKSISSTTGAVILPGYASFMTSRTHGSCPTLHVAFTGLPQSVVKVSAYGCSHMPCHYLRRAYVNFNDHGSNHGVLSVHCAKLSIHIVRRCQLGCRDEGLTPNLLERVVTY